MPARRVLSRARLASAASGADACTGLNCPQAEITDNGIIATARAEMDELNAGYPGRPPPTNCTEDKIGAGADEVMRPSGVPFVEDRY